MLDNDAYSSPLPTVGKGLSAERALRNAIVHGVLLPGERLSETGLCQQFAIGRAAVRVALAQLQERGFVSSAARSGWRVTPICAAEIRETITARRRLEPLLASIACSDSDRTHLAQLGDMYAALGSRLQAGSELQVTQRRYERDMMELLANRLGMDNVASWLIDLWDRSMRLVLFFEAQGAPKLKPADRTGLAASLVHGDAVQAEKLIITAIEELEGYLAARFMESAAVVGGTGNTRPDKAKAAAKPMGHTGRRVKRSSVDR
jgi:DNA-binding GntR family transcriptional regulator